MVGFGWLFACFCLLMLFVGGFWFGFAGGLGFVFCVFGWTCGFVDWVGLV